MKITEKDIAAKWTDNYLDLYNFAIEIGDTEWQQHILQTLKARDAHIALEIQHGLRVDLWLRFDAINRKVLELYEQLHNVQYSDAERRQLTEKVWEFKLQRIMIASKLKEHYVAQGETL
ncbi:hypothetical protein ACX93W_19395 [Paenibacillus sp. CAU 1782]